MGLVARKPVFGVSSKASFKPVSSATETSKKIEISPVSSLDMILSKNSVGQCRNLGSRVHFLVKVILIDFQLEKYMQSKEKDVYNFFLQ